jgi:hypothetical protein
MVGFQMDIHAVNSNKHVIKKITIILFLCFSLLQTRNTFSQQGVVVAGGDVSGNSGSVSFSYGQVDYTFSGNDITVWQGIQQVYDKLVAVVDKSITVTVWPNPVVNRLYIKVNDINGSGITYQLFSLDGKRMAGDIVKLNETSIAMNTYASASYILLVTHVNKKILSFKIIKK